MPTAQAISPTEEAKVQKRDVLQYRAQHHAQFPRITESLVHIGRLKHSMRNTAMIEFFSQTKQDDCDFLIHVQFNPSKSERFSNLGFGRNIGLVGN